MFSARKGLEALFWHYETFGQRTVFEKFNFRKQFIVFQVEE